MLELIVWKVTLELDFENKLTLLSDRNLISVKKKSPNITVASFFHCAFDENKAISGIPREES